MQYAVHDCNTLLGTSGALTTDSMRKFVSVHIEIDNTRKERNI